jgi:hypothetical protein
MFVVVVVVECSTLARIGSFGGCFGIRFQNRKLPGNGSDFLIQTLLHHDLVYVDSAWNFPCD